MSLSELMIDIPAEHEMNVFGQFDAYVKKARKNVSCYVDRKRRNDKDRWREQCCSEGTPYPHSAC